MTSQINEEALESAIEKHLTGTCLEDIKLGVSEASPRYLDNSLYRMAYPSDYNKKYALDEKIFWEFLEKTQSDELEKIKKHSPNDWRLKILERFDRLMKKYGILHLLKKSFSVDDAVLHLMYPVPLASSSDKIKQDFASNIFSCMRQVPYNEANPREEIDMVFFINGIPLITLELKNEWTGQNARYHGQKQYREDRDTRQTLLNFGRCLVHMTADTDEVYMTTRLAGQETFFLPFNRGFKHGQGNPVNKYGHKTAYLWEDVLQKKSLANIIQHFVRFDGSMKEPLPKKTLFFPRYHQRDVVRRLVSHACENGVGHTYLIQHSAGSGKSNSITWAAYQLIETYPSCLDLPGAKALDEPLFDSVIVVTDRRVLDKQLRDNISNFSEIKNIIAPAYKSAELKRALEGGKKIIITTIQKFPWIIDGISDLSDKRFAVIIDEAHSSQSGTAHDNMNRAMGNMEDEDEDTNQDKILQAMESRKMRGNASYFAFTATPKNTTLEKFGQQQDDGSYKPFHLYSMKQAIEEGFILDVLANYTTYKSYYEIVKSIADNPRFDSKKAQKKLRTYVERSPQTIEVKAEIILDHFMNNVVNARKLKGQARGMVLTQNIETAIRYYKSIAKLLHERGNPFKALIAFSGAKQVDGIEYTEASINGFPEKDTKDMFDKNYTGATKPAGVNEDANRLLIVANKYLTGFDQPKLCAMYVDKKLQHVLAVQALSRLNRAAPKLAKKTEDLSILDFFNNTDDIKKSFDPFYTATSLSKATDVNVLHELKDSLDEVGVYEWEEAVDFTEKYIDGVEAQLLSPIIDTAAARFTDELGLEEKEKVDFKVKAKQFVKVYAQMASIMPFQIRDWEILFWFLKYLIPKLKVNDPTKDEMDKILESVDLGSYGLERVCLNQKIGLDETEAEVDPQNPNPRGGHGTEEEKDALDDIISSFNERWFQSWSATPEEQRVKFISMTRSIAAHPDFKAKCQENADPHTRALAFDKILKEVMLKHRKKEQELYKLYAKDTEFNTSFKKTLQRLLACE